MAIEIRPARVAEIPHMAAFAMDAFNGYGEVMYAGVIPGRSAAALTEHRFSRAGTTASLAHSRIAEQDGVVLGGLHAFPADAGAGEPPDPLIPEARYAVFAPFERLHAPGSYYVNIVAVYPEWRGQGVARRLLAAAEAEAAAQGLGALSLTVFEDNAPALRLYRRLGYTEAARAPVVPHPHLRYGGDLLLMVKGG